MTAVEHVILIHGTWGNGEGWVEARAAFEQRGFVVHTPTLRHHELPILAGARKIASLSLTDYADDLVAQAESLSSPPLLVGLSMGGLLAQLVAARTPHAGLVAAAPAPAAGIFALYPRMTKLFASHFLQPRPWAKPLAPTWERWRTGVVNEQSEEFAEEIFQTLVMESGRAYCEMGFPWLDRHHAARVDFSAITGPVLIIGAERDHVVVPQIARATASRYSGRAKHVEIKGSDHMMFFGRYLPVTMGEVDRWMIESGLKQVGAQRK